MPVEQEIEVFSMPGWSVSHDEIHAMGAGELRDFAQYLERQIPQLSDPDDVRDCQAILEDVRDELSLRQP